MKKLLLLLISILFLSCVSLPNPDESTKGMLIIPLELDNKENLEIFGNYRLTFTSLSDGSKITRIVTPANTYSQVYFEPGEYELSLVEFIYNGGGVNNKTSEHLSIGFIIEHGQINIFPNKFITRNYSNSSGQYMNRGIVNTNYIDKKKIKEYLENQENYNLWILKKY